MFFTQMPNHPLSLKILLLIPIRVPVRITAGYSYTES